MRTIYLAILLILLVSAELSAQNKVKTFQYTPGINNRTITGTITKITCSNYAKKKLNWVYLGDTILHIWGKDLTKKIAVGQQCSFVGVQRLTGVRKLTNKSQDMQNQLASIF
ncbi:hypothetical protein [Pedobacter sp. SL55]|uniref:hypothetical protein n=1 Tax=Pedobacter sp. SL55 TaxID=2995161 RepID=UPI00226EA74B|nr:hypothetical protein [Pedobacter sp. SL55]WAC41287.1 hypothetical protein OVA16_02645 [Pedobacter sp. SL55]